MERIKNSVYYLVLCNVILISNAFTQSSITDFTVEPEVDRCSYKYVSFYYVGGNVYSADSLLWNFGDGHTQGNSFSDHAIHTYNTPGFYSVSLTVWKNGIETFIEKPDTIKIYNAPKVSYSYHAISGALQLIAPVEVLFESSVIKGDGDSITYNWYIDSPLQSIGSNEDKAIQFDEIGQINLGLQVKDENGCDARHTEEIVIMDSVQANEFEFLTGDYNSDSCTGGFNYKLENDTLRIHGNISLNCCGTHTTAYETVSDSIIFHFYHKGEVCECNSLFCFEIKVPDISENYMNVHFYNVDTLIVKEGLAFIDTYACGNYISPSGKAWTNEGIYQDTIPNTLGGDSIIIIRLAMYENSYGTLVKKACDEYISPSGKIWNSSGIYQDTIPNSVGCYHIITIYLTMDCTNSVKNSAGIPAVIYPNPTKEYIHIKLDKFYEDICIEFYDITGRVSSTMKYKNVDQIEYKVNESQGIYFLKIYNNEEEISVFKILIE